MGVFFHLLGFAEVAHQATLRLAELLRRLHHHLYHQVPTTMLVEMRNALAAQAELLARLRALLDTKRGLSLERRYLNLIAQCKLGKGDEDHAIEVVAITFKELVGLYRQYDIKIYLRSTGTSCISF